MNRSRAPIDVPLTLLTVLTCLCSVILVIIVVVLVLVVRRRRYGPADGAPALRSGRRRWTGAFAPFVVGDPGRAASGVRPRAAERSWDRRDTVLDGITLSHAGTDVAELRAASVRGLSHANYGVVRQDEYAFRVTSDGRHLVAVVADGVSAGRYSDQAAMIVTRRGAELVAQHVEVRGPQAVPWHEVVRDLAALVIDRGRQLVGAGGGPLSDHEIAGELAATALFAVVDLVPGAGGCAVEIMALGDTSAWVLREDRWEPLQQVKNAGRGIASSGTAAIPALPSTLNAPVRTSVRPGEALVLVTDGVGDALGSGRGDVPDFLAEVWATPPRGALEFAAHVGFARKSFDDDRTAVVLWPTLRPTPRGDHSSVRSNAEDSVPTTHLTRGGTPGRRTVAREQPDCEQRTRC